VNYSIKEIKELCNKATEGPWKEDDGNIFSEPLSKQRQTIIMRIIKGEKDLPHPDDGLDNPLGWIASTEQGQPNFENDAEFIANAREIIPFLLNEVEKAQAVCGKYFLNKLEDQPCILRPGHECNHFTGFSQWKKD